MTALKAEIANLSSPKVFKRGYAYQNGKGVEFCVVCTQGSDEHFPIITLRISNQKLENVVDAYKSNGRYYDGAQRRFDLIHETERLFDATMVENDS